MELDKYTDFEAGQGEKVASSVLYVVLLKCVQQLPLQVNHLQRHNPASLMHQS